MHDLNTIIEMNKPGGIQPQTIISDSRPKPRIVINVTGGIVQEVLSTEPIDYAIVDYDTDGVESENIINMPDKDGKTEQAYAYTSPANVMPELTNKMFDAI